MEKLKCESCGANLEIDENQEYATCPYCKLKYKLKKDDNFNINLQLDEGTKETLKKRGKVVAKIGIVYIIGSFIVTIIVIGAIVFGVTKIFGFVSKEINNQLDANTEEDNIFDKESFNSDFEMYSGKRSKLFVKELLNDVITNNEKPKSRIISIIYGSYNTTDSQEILNIQDLLVNDDYNVLLDYDSKGYVTSITLQD